MSFDSVGRRTAVEDPMACWRVTARALVLVVAMIALSALLQDPSPPKLSDAAPTVDDEVPAAEG